MAGLNYLFVIFLSVISFHCAFSQIGKDCVDDTDCFDEFNCEMEMCICKPKHIQAGIHCFPEVGFGEVCYYEEQCNDYRLVCVNSTNEIVMRCSCDRFHDYNYSLMQCAPKRNISAMLTKSHHSAEDIASQSDSRFIGILVAGTFITACAFLGCISAILYCIRIFYQDDTLDKEVTALIAKHGTKKSTKVADVEKDIAGDASLAPMVACNMDFDF